MGSHLFHLNATPPQNIYPNGTRIDVTQSLFPPLKEMALSFLSLHPQGFREPHWHPNAHELSYCLEGKALMTIFSPEAGHDTFLIEPGTLTFVPMGYLHHIQNIGSEPIKMLLCFNDDQPEEINLSSAVGVMPPHALGATFSLPSSFFEGLTSSVQPIFIAEYTQEVPLSLSWQTNRFKIDIGAIQAQVQSSGGYVKIVNSLLMPILKNLTLYSLVLESKGIREPHWHPNAHELNYLIKGHARITLLSPPGKVDTFDMGPGDMSFLPKGYFHYIENLGEDPAHFAVFFNHDTPSDIGLSGCFGAYSNALLADLFQVPVAYFKPLPKYQKDLFIVAGGG